jgi:hypothetical protein
MAALRNFVEYPTNLNHTEFVLTFQDIYKGEIKYANTAVIQWAFLGGFMLNALYSVNLRLFRQWCIIVIA